MVRDEPPPDWPSTERPLRIILEPSARKKELPHAARQGASASGLVRVGRIWAAAGSDGALHEAHGGIGQREGRAAKVEPKHCDGAEARSIDGGSQGRLGRHGMGCGGDCSGGGWQGRAFRDNVRHRRHGSSGAPALTRSLAVALLKGALEGSLQVPAQRLPYLDGSRLGGGARLAGRSCGVAAQRTVPPSDSSRSEHAVRSPPPGTCLQRESRRRVAPPTRSGSLSFLRGQTQQNCRLGRPLSLWLKGHGLCISAGSARCWALGGYWVGSPPEGSPTSLQIQPHDELMVARHGLTMKLTTC